MAPADSISKPLVSILIITWNRSKALARSIDSAMVQTYPNTEVLVVDNASADDTAEMLARKYPQVRSKRLENNVGPAVARNIGIPLCRGDLVYLLDDDGWLEPTAVAKCVDTMLADPTLAVVSSHIYEVRDGRLVGKRPTVSGPSYQAGFGAGCSLYRKDAFVRVGLWPTDFFRQGEEPDLALRLLEDGMYCLVQPASIMYHEASPVGRSKEMFIYYLLRNTNKSALRHWPFPWCALRVCINLAYAVRYMIVYRFFTLPVQICWNLFKDLGALRGRRKPVGRETMRIYLELRKGPSLIRPVWRSKVTNELARAGI